jgi:hypothetical protein
MTTDIQRIGVLNRRTVLAGAIGALAAAATRVLNGADRVLAGPSNDGSTVVIGGQYHFVGTTTLLQNQSTDRSLVRLDLGNPHGNRAALVASAAGGAGVSGTSQSNAGLAGASVSGPGVSARSDTASGLVGTAGRSGSADAHVAHGVLGETGLVNGSGVFGWNQSDTTGAGVRGRADGSSGIAVLGRVRGQSATGVRGIADGQSGAGVWGQANGADGVGVRGHASNGSSSRDTFGTGVLGTAGSHTSPPPAPIANTGVVGIATGGIGVYGHDNQGRGGVFGGRAAQIRLLPSPANKPPDTGSKGDFFVDSAGRLWFCRGSLGWTRLA